MPPSAFPVLFMRGNMRGIRCLRSNATRWNPTRDLVSGHSAGFYTDKRTWISIRLDGGVERERILRLCDASYDLVFARLTRRARMEIMDGGT